MVIEEEFVEGARELYAFLSDYRAWVDAGAPEDEPFSRCWGLCGNIGYIVACYADSFVCEDELHAYLGRDFGCNLFPFNTDANDYTRENGRHHLNPARMAWVDKTISELKRELNLA